MRAPRSLGTALCVGVALAAVPRAAAADQAKDLFEKGAEALTAGKYDVACPALEQSQRLDPHLGTLFALAECEAAWRHGASALAHYGEYLRLYEALPRDKQIKQIEREKQARTAKSDLERTVPTLTLVLPPGAPSATLVKSDGILVPATNLGLAIPVDPGEHVIGVQVPGGVMSEQRLRVEAGERRTLVLDVKPPAAARSEASSSPGPSARRVGAYVVGGIGVAGLVVGAVTGGLMLSKKSAISDGCKPTPDGVQHCTQAGADAGESAKTLGAAASAGFAFGLAGLGVGLGLFFSEPPAERSGAPIARVTIAPLRVGPTSWVIAASGVF